MYNVGTYLAEAIESVINQSGGMFAKTELVLVDDGSEDDTAAIAKAYRDKYPNNIRYYFHSNHGVSYTRNRGIRLSNGKYLGFLDPDDRYSGNVLAVVSEFFEQNKDCIDVVSLPIEFFGARTGSHVLNNKFEGGSRVIDVEEEWQYIQGSLSTSFVKRATLESLGITLDRRLKYAEDLKFMTMLIMNKGKYGVVTGCSYFYRKRFEGGSALDNNTDDREYYQPVLNYFASELLQRYRSADGVIPKYVQMAVAYDLQWRILQRKCDVLSNDELEIYKETLKNLLSQLSIEVILAQRHVQIDHKLFMLSQSIGTDVLAKLRLRDHSVFLNGTKVWGAPARAFTCVVERIEAHQDTIVIRGFNRGLPISQIAFGFCVDGRFYQSEQVPTPSYRAVQFLGDVVFEPRYFRFEFRLGEFTRLKPAVKYGGRLYYPKFDFRKNSGLLNGRSSYALVSSYIIQNVRNKYVAIKPYSRGEHLRRELSYSLGLIKNSKVVGSERSKLTLIGYRLVAVFLSYIKRRPLWLISDRVSAAGDNGEALFIHLMNNPGKRRAKIVFLQSAGSPERETLRKIGKVIDPNSFRGRIAYLNADILASSLADDYVLNPFGRDWRIMDDLYRFRFVFLQHGVIIHDLSEWINIYDKPIAKFITSAHREYESIRNSDYGFEEEHLELSGLPRHDRLYSAANRTITIAPTWRKNLVLASKEANDVHPYNDKFVESEFYLFYSSLFTNERFLQALEEFDFSVKFVLHPNLVQQARDFETTDRIEVVTPPYIYRDLISEAGVFVTDYSSVVMDAAYLRKRIVYAHFDSVFDGKHTIQEGYFDYEEDGFGPVTTGIDELVEELICAMAEGCVPLPEYRSRMDNFFAYADSKNCERVAEIIDGILDR